MRVLITGASGDIGAAIAEKLANPGYIMYLHYHKNNERAEEVRKQCEAAGAEAFCLQADLTMTEGAAKLVEQLFTPVDIIIHVAGHSLQGLFTQTTDDELMDVMMVHLFNPIKITRALLPTMINQQSGKVIGLSSIWGVIGASNEVLYSTAKAGLNGFIKSLAKEVALSGVQVNAVAPGAIDTSMLAVYSSEELEALKLDIPAGRLGSPTDIAETVSFLASNRADYINGQIIEVNGAWN
ncbi:elongation factor P 5-aminopentanone reductase [Alkalicoccobacillus porphyridii]|uniref:SDR family oxidoreductase n=1 Tax=Alkalicoccobacillus porphyridii TaxID=2597270 RepID=A0A553ZYK9_9BACI|nr:SDR family oxidoreductase [Alkalicoccobacillus porphyridii]TSB46466.1 SDR family oxidoreductase [Alkalicoccobacillus porphyridii]